jgi:sorbitol-specific phosphotransferase system component IIA
MSLVKCPECLRLCFSDSVARESLSEANYITIAFNYADEMELSGDPHLTEGL